jgi:hypothetical protein
MGSFFRAKISILSFLILFLGVTINSAQKEKVEQLKIGNFALLSSQQPGPLIGFGQNMLDKGDLQLFSYIDYLNGKNKEFIGVVPTLLYGFTPYFSLFLQLPVAAKFQEDATLFRGIQEALIQFEYSFYSKETPTETNQISLVTNIALSPDPELKSIRRGLAITNLFVGFTASHMGTRWYPFASAGAIITTKDDNKTKYGNQFLYECGLSGNIWSAEDTYIFNWMLELDGFYQQRDKVCGVCDPNSGGNTILFGPSLWFSSPRFVAQAGISWFVYEKLFGKQNKSNYYICIDIGWKF